MFLFGKSKCKKLTATLVGELKKARETVKSAETAAKISECIKNLESMVRKTKEEYLTLLEASALIEEAIANIANENESGADVALNQVSTRVINISVYKSTVKNSDKIGTPEEQFDRLIAKLSDSLKAKKAKLRDCKERAKDPDDGVAFYELQKLEIQIKNIEEKIDLYGDATLRETMVEAIKSLKEEHQRTLITQSVDDAQFAMIMDDLEATRSEIQKSKDLTRRAKEAYMNGSASRSTSETSSTTAFRSFSDRNRQPEQSEAVSGTASLPELTTDIDSAIENINDALTICQREAADIGKRLMKIANVLEKLLVLRKSMNSVECKIIDIDIDRFIVDKDTFTEAIDSYTNLNSQLLEQLKLARSAAIRRNIAENSAIINQTGIFTKNMESIAIGIKDSISENNERLEYFNTVNMVAHSEDIKRRAGTLGISAASYDPLKDENKYAAIEAELGMR